jgi:hypothetical protein
LSSHGGNGQDTLSADSGCKILTKSLAISVGRSSNHSVLPGCQNTAVPSKSGLYSSPTHQASELKGRPLHGVDSREPNELSRARVWLAYMRLSGRAPARITRTSGRYASTTLTTAPPRTWPKP